MRPLLTISILQKEAYHPKEPAPVELWNAERSRGALQEAMQPLGPAQEEGV